MGNKLIKYLTFLIFKKLMIGREKIIEKRESVSKL